MAKLLGYASAIVVAALLAAALFMFGPFRSEPAGPPGTARHYIIGLSPNYPSPLRKPLTEAMLSLLMRDMASGSSFVVVDAWNNVEVARGDVPDDPGFNPQPGNKEYNNRRVRLLDAQRLKINAFIQTPNATAQNLDPSSLKVTRFLQDAGKFYLRQNDRIPIENNQIILIGDPIFHDPGALEWSFREGFYPSDGAIRAPDAESLFGTDGKKNLLQGVPVHFAFGATPKWFDFSHEAQVGRFWSLYVQGVGGKLVTFGDDLSLAFRQAADGKKIPKLTPVFEPDSVKVEMVAIRRKEIDQTLRELLFEPTAKLIEKYKPQNRPLRSKSGAARIGIAWGCQTCDMDLYVSDGKAADELYYARRQTITGRFYKDFAAIEDVPAPIRGYEYVELDNVADIRAIAIGVNFYSGALEGGVSGTLRVEFEGWVYAYEFHVPAPEGNFGTDRYGDRRRSTHWQVKQLGDLLPP